MICCSHHFGEVYPYWFAQALAQISLSLYSLIARVWETPWLEAVSWFPVSVLNPILSFYQSPYFSWSISFSSSLILFISLSFSSVCVFNSSFTAVRRVSLRPAHDLLPSDGTEAAVGKLAARGTDNEAESSQRTRQRRAGGYLWPTTHLNLAPESEIMTSLCLILMSHWISSLHFDLPFHNSFYVSYSFLIVLRFQCHVSPMARLYLHGTAHHIRYWATHHDLDLIECQLKVSPRFQQTGLSQLETWLTRIYR